MNYTLAPTNSDIIHYGVSAKDGAPGRGSGRYPLGSGKEGQKAAKREAKLEKYKTRQSNMLISEQTRINKKLEKAKNLESGKNLRRQDRLRQIDLEMKAVQNMSFEDMSKEKKAQAIAAFEAALVTGVTAGITQIPVVVVMVPDFKQTRTKVRIGENDSDVWRNARLQKKQIKAAKKAANGG